MSDPLVPEIPTAGTSDVAYRAIYRGDYATPAHVAARERGRPPLLRELVVAAKVAGLGARSVIDVGCNDGHLAALLVAQRIQTTVMDVDSDIVNAAKERAPGAIGMIGLAEDLECHPSPAWDVVTCCEVVEHVRDPRRVVDALRHVAKRAVVITTPVGHDYDDPLHIHHWRDEDELASGLGLDGFKSFVIERIPSKIGDRGRVFVVVGVV